MKKKITPIINFRSNGKLMLTGEYLVLKGAKSLALPLRFGQDLTIKPIEGNSILWESRVKGKPWFQAEFNLTSLEIISCNLTKVANTLQQILQTAKALNPDFLNEDTGFRIQAEIDFKLEWGVGASSSLISNVALWANCDPYELNRKVFKGSGYDIACARSNSAVRYQLANGVPVVDEIDFHPVFSDQLFFVWLNRKQDTRDEIGRLKSEGDFSNEILELNAITEEIIKTDSLDQFEKLIQQHEQIISQIIETTPVQQVLFNDFKGSVKSLGAWGGDFVMVVSSEKSQFVKKYFNQKGYQTVLSFNKLFNLSKV